MALEFYNAPIHKQWRNQKDWPTWTWQFRNALKTLEDFTKIFLFEEETKKSFLKMKELFQIQATPYYASLAMDEPQNGAIRKILMPSIHELGFQQQQMLDPLNEQNNNPAPRVIHRYPDRALFLVTDLCSVYCRYCTRKHFTAKEQAFASTSEYDQALSYFKKQKKIREVILSGGDPLTLSDVKLETVLSDLRSMDHIELVRVGTRMPVVNPFRITNKLVGILKKYNPLYMMLHFNHPDELTLEAKVALDLLVDNGIVCLNQMVLLNGINNHPAIVQALSRRLLYLRVKPYYMHQCDPSEGTDHLRTSIDDSMKIQRELWGVVSGLMMPNLSIDIPGGGGKVGIVPNFKIREEKNAIIYKGWDGIEASYINPNTVEKPMVSVKYQKEWLELNS